MAKEAQETTLAPWAESVPGHAAGEHMTADELLALPDDGWRYELVEGRLVRMAPPGGTHGEIAAMLPWALSSFVIPRKLGRILAAETGFELGPAHVLGADAAFVRAERVPPREDAARNKYWRLAPDLVGPGAEDGSPSTTSKRDGDSVFWVWCSAQSGAAHTARYSCSAPRKMAAAARYWSARCMRAR